MSVCLSVRLAICLPRHCFRKKCKALLIRLFSVISMFYASDTCSWFWLFFFFSFGVISSSRWNRKVSGLYLPWLSFDTYLRDTRGRYYEAYWASLLLDILLSTCVHFVHAALWPCVKDHSAIGYDAWQIRATCLRRLLFCLWMDHNRDQDVITSDDPRDGQSLVALAISPNSKVRAKTPVLPIECRDVGSRLSSSSMHVQVFREDLLEYSITDSKHGWIARRCP